MISIIVCSRNPAELSRFSESVSGTIGLPFEIVAIDNSQNKHSIFSAYNEGARRSRYDLLCFSHEDIAFHTKDWGKILEQIFTTDASIGLIGVAGSNYRTLVPSSWGSHADSNYINLIQGSGRDKTEGQHWINNPTKETLANVVCVDGVWFCTRKQIALSTGFDEKTFSGFHCYDIDYSLSVLQQFRVAVTSEVLIEHFSQGSYSRDWIEASLTLHQKWQNSLPVSANGPQQACRIEFELEAALRFSGQMISLGYKPLEIFRAMRFVNKKLSLPRVQLVAFCLRVMKMYFRHLLSGKK